MRQIIIPHLPGQKPVQLKKDLHGNVLILMGNEAAKLPPRQAYDMAVLLLRAVGCEINETFKRPDDLGGGQLKAKVKIA